MSNLDRLSTLAKSGKFVFHGSPKRVELLVPMQATKVDENFKNTVNDGEPAVAATPYLDIAIFRALVNKTISPDNYKSGFSLNDGVLHFKASQEALDCAKMPGVAGYVHVLNIKVFKPYSPKEVRSAQPVEPIEIIEVTAEDLPNNIEII